MHNEVTQAADNGTRVIARYIDSIGDSHSVNCRIVENYTVVTSPFGSTRTTPAALQIIEHHSGFGPHGAVLIGTLAQTARGGDAGRDTLSASLEVVGVDRESDALILLRAGYRVALL